MLSAHRSLHAQIARDRVSDRLGVRPLAGAAVKRLDAIRCDFVKNGVDGDQVLSPRIHFTASYLEA